MEFTLVHLIDALKSTLSVLNGEAHSDLLSALHDYSSLPNKKTVGLAATAVDLLHEVKLLLEPAPLVLADHFLGYTDSKCLSAAVELKIPDLLRDGPESVVNLAKISGASPIRLKQILRVLRNNGIFSYDATTALYSNNHISSLLLTDHWTQWHRWVTLYGSEFYDIARGIPQAVRDDCKRTPAQVNFDTDETIISYFSKSGLGRKVHDTLAAGAVAQAPGILEDYPWEQVSKVCDVGGGAGGLVSSLLRKHASMRATIVDIPDVIEQAAGNFHSQGGQYADVGDRVELVPGDFFQSLPSYSVYAIKWCLHNWDDERASQILRTIRASVAHTPESRLIVLESVVEEGRSRRLSRYADMNMMMTIGGGERTEAEWRTLAEASGWEVRKIYSLRNAWPSAIEMVPKGDDNSHKASNSVQTNGVQTNGVEANGVETNGVQTNGVQTESVQINGVHTNGLSKAEVNQTSLVPSQRFKTKMSFLEPWDLVAKGGEPFFRNQPDEGQQKQNFGWAEHDVYVEDVRPNRSAFNINDNAFAFVDDPNGLTEDVTAALRRNDTDAIKKLYYPSVQALIQKITGAERVIIFDHTVRKKDPKLIGSNPDGQEQPATIVHCDQSAKGAVGRVEQNISGEDNIDELLKNRVQLINVWRPLRSPVLDWPLAVMDYRSLSKKDIHPCTLYRAKDEYRGETVTLCHSDEQRWYYLDQQTMHEVTLIKIWDNKAEAAEMCGHCAFKHPETPDDAPPRESVEVRCIVLHSSN